MIVRLINNIENIFLKILLEVCITTPKTILIYYIDFIVSMCYSKNS
jgi:hypothetical protein